VSRGCYADFGEMHRKGCHSGHCDSEQSEESLRLDREILRSSVLPQNAIAEM